MSQELFDSFNLLRSDESTYKSGFSGTALSVASGFTSTTQWSWSNSLANAALDYLHFQGPCASYTDYQDTSIFKAGMVGYFFTACQRREVIETHSINTQGTWTGTAAKATIKSWFASSKFNFADLKDDSFTHVGVACDCNPSGDSVKCAFMFSREFLPKALTHWIPKQFPFTASASCNIATLCPTINDAFTNSDSVCSASLFADPEDGCTACSTRHHDCTACKYKGAHWSTNTLYTTMVDCTACAGGFDVE